MAHYGGSDYIRLYSDIVTVMLVSLIQPIPTRMPYISNEYKIDSFTII